MRAPRIFEERRSSFPEGSDFYNYKRSEPVEPPVESPSGFDFSDFEKEDDICDLPKKIDDFDEPIILESIDMAFIETMQPFQPTPKAQVIEESTIIYSKPIDLMPIDSLPDNSIPMECPMPTNDPTPTKPLPTESIPMEPFEPMEPAPIDSAPMDYSAPAELPTDSIPVDYEPIEMKPVETTPKPATPEGK